MTDAADAANPEMEEQEEELYFMEPRGIRYPEYWKNVKLLVKSKGSTDVFGAYCKECDT